MWNYYFNNIGEDRPVAIYYNEKNLKVLEVIETRDSHLSVPYFHFIKSFSVPYSDEVTLSDELPTDSTDEILKKRLKAACKLIEENYKEQVGYIEFII